MIDSNFEVDTAKVRQAARNIRSVASQVQDLAKQNVKTMKNTVDSELVGSTADALMEMLTELGSDVEKIASALNSIQSLLFTYAEKLEEKDAELAAKIGG